jgi:molybdopterin-containing oxidoreductase family membrane subunit
VAQQTSSDSVLGLFREPDNVAAALDALRAAGFRGTDLKILSGVPYPDGAFGEETEQHRLYVFPFVGAACGLSVGLLLTVATQLAFPLDTGGKPVLSIPPMVNVMYEGTMLGAVLFTVLGIIFESRLPNLTPAPYDERITEGLIGVLVTRAEDRVALAQRTLHDAGALDVLPRSHEQPVT